MNRTKIEYLTHSWNPLAMRCTPVSEGCEHCWHQAMARRLAANRRIPAKEREAYAGGLPVMREGELDAPFRLRKPALIGVQFMGDLFHEDIWYGLIYELFTNVMAKCPQHTFLVLTKRPEGALGFSREAIPLHDFAWPKNVWLGVSVENQKRADERIPILLQIPAAVRFVSIEPMLGPVDLTRLILATRNKLDALRGIEYSYVGADEDGRAMWDDPVTEGDWIDGVIVGGESGPGARPMHPKWVRDVRDQCVAAGIPFFLKQLGAWRETAPIEGIRKGDAIVWKDGKVKIWDGRRPGVLLSQDAVCMRCYGKKAAGRLLDGREWNDLPERAR